MISSAALMSRTHSRKTTVKSATFCDRFMLSALQMKSTLCTRAKFNHSDIQMFGVKSPGRLTSFRFLNNIRETMAKLLIALLDRITTVLHFKSLEQSWIKIFVPDLSCIVQPRRGGRGRRRVQEICSCPYHDLKEGHGCFCPVTDEVWSWHFSAWGWLQWLIL